MDPLISMKHMACWLHVKKNFWHYSMISVILLDINLEHYAGVIKNLHSSIKQTRKPVARNRGQIKMIFFE